MSSPFKGPEKATYPERLVTSFRIPFIVGTLILSIFCGPLGAVLVAYTQTRDINGAIGKTFSLFFGGQVPIQNGILALVLLSVAFFYAICMIRRTRLRLLDAEVSLIPLLPQGEQTFNRSFGRVCRVGPSAALGLLFIVSLVVLSSPEAVLELSYMAYCTDPVSIAFVIIVLPLWLLVFGTFAWVYFGSILGLREIGKTPLKMKSFREDRMLGMKPIGSLSLSLAFMYFVGLGILTVASIVSMEVLTYLVTQWFMIVLTFLGVVLFFLPLNAFHRQMLGVKRQEQEALRIRLFTLGRTQDGLGDSHSKSSSMKHVRDELIRLSETLTATATEKEVSAIFTWPFDPAILGRLGAMVVTILTLILGNLILTWIKTNIFHIP